MQLKSNADLRAALSIHFVDWPTHSQQVLAVAKRHPHSVKFVTFVDSTTCAPLALRLAGEPMYDAIRTRFRHTHPKAFAGKAFMAWLQQGRLAELSEPEEGCLVCYFSPDGWQHIGLMNAGRVQSKWGEQGVYDHELAEVPDCYGECVRFYKRPSAPRIRHLFREYVRDLGLSNEEIDRAVSKSRLKHSLV